MKMFLTRLGFGSRIVITGDITQIDLPQEKKSGLIQVRNILDKISGIEFVYLTSKDVVRHSLVQKIVDAYKIYEEILVSENLKNVTEKNGSKE
jgi:phosphate starvation-inducible PhoH-like protein